MMSGLEPNDRRRVRPGRASYFLDPAAGASAPVKAPTSLFFIVSSSLTLADCICSGCCGGLFGGSERPVFSFKLTQLEVSQTSANRWHTTPHCGQSQRGSFPPRFAPAPYPHSQGSTLDSLQAPVLIRDLALLGECSQHRLPQVCP